jgi:hypothetical protein
VRVSHRGSLRIERLAAMGTAGGTVEYPLHAVPLLDVAEAIHQELMDSLVRVAKGLAHACLLQNARASRDLEGALCGISAC